MHKKAKLLLIGTAALVMANSSWISGSQNIAVCRAENLPDPTRPPAVIGQPQAQVSDHATGKWEVTSILVSPGRRVAIINGERHQEGDTIAGAVLLKIDPLAVTLRKNSRDFSVGLGGNRVKSPVAVTRKEAIGK